jgi:hypothetical protein
MKATKNISIFLISIFSIFQIGCNDRTEFYCNHNTDRDTLSHLDFSGINFPTGQLKLTTFQLKSDTIPVGGEKIYDNQLIDLLNNNMLINGYIDYRKQYDLFRWTGTNDFITRLIIKFNKNTFKFPSDYKPIDYEKYRSDSTSLFNDYYILGKLDLSNKFDSYVISNHRKKNEIEGMYFDRNEISYYLLNIDKSKRLISTARLANILSESDGLSFFQEELKMRSFFKCLFFYSKEWYIVSLDLPDHPGNSHKTKFFLRLKRNGEIS